jgi:CO/xanthine dehydrogenase Mo-binding subunit
MLGQAEPIGWEPNGHRNPLVGAVAEVEVDRGNGAISIPRFYVVHDCGQIINPDGLKNQIEGGVIQTISRALIEKLKFDRAEVTSLDWQSYPILTFPQVPEVVIDLIVRPTMPPFGVREPAAAVVPSAIANALFDATGVRLRFSLHAGKGQESDSRTIKIERPTRRGAGAEPRRPGQKRLRKREQWIWWCASAAANEGTQWRAY